MGSQLVLWMPEKKVGCVLRSTPPEFPDGPQLLLWAYPKEGRRGEGWDEGQKSRRERWRIEEKEEEGGQREQE